MSKNLVVKIKYKDRNLTSITSAPGYNSIYKDKEMNDLIVEALENNGSVEVWKHG